MYRSQEQSLSGNIELFTVFFECLRTLEKCKLPHSKIYYTLVCSPNHVHNFTAESSLRASALGTPTRAHGMRYYKSFSQARTFTNEITEPTLPPRSLASGAVPAYSCVIAPRVTVCIFISRLCGNRKSVSVIWTSVSWNAHTIANFW